MKLFGKCGTALAGLMVSFGCLAVDPPCWKLETEGAAPGDVCWFSDKMASGVIYTMSSVAMKDGKVGCSHEGDREDRFIKKFGWLNADRESLRAHFSSQQSIKTFISSYKWCSESKETKARPLPVVNASEISEETVSLETVRENGTEYSSLGILSSGSGEIKELGRFYKSGSVAARGEEKLYITIYAGCAWAMAFGQGKAKHHDPKPNWDMLFASKAGSFDKERNWWTGDRLDYNNCEGGNNFGFIKVEVYASQLPEKAREFYRKRQ